MKMTEHSQTSFDTLVLTLLAFLFLFSVLFFVSNGRVLEALTGYAQSLGAFLSKMIDGLSR